MSVFVLSFALLVSQGLISQGVEAGSGTETPAVAEGESRAAVAVPLTDSREVAIADVVNRLAGEAGVEVRLRPTDLSLPVDGLAGVLTRRLLVDALGPEFKVAVEANVLSITIDGRMLVPERRPELARRLSDLAERAEKAAERSSRHGFRPLRSYHANDPSRPAVCLIHGLNSTSGSFVHMIVPLEAAGYGIVLYDFPFNRPLEESCDHFAEDWAAFREQTGERRPWAIVAHSMGALVARSYIEDDALWRGDVNSLILIAPVSQGSNLAKAQPVLQFVNSLKAVNGGDTSAALARLSDGLGKAADDILPSSDFLATLNRRPRRKSVNYHILAGDTGILRPKERQEIEHRLGLLTKNAGLLGTFARKATADVPAILDELTDGTGDGCVTVESTRLPGADDHVTIHANHAELIRAPLLFSDDGPVACMPDVLRWLRADTASQRGAGQAPSGRRRRPASPAP